jgi:RNA polymerase sigma-70 factor (ECF subfamily)
MLSPDSIVDTTLISDDSPAVQPDAAVLALFDRCAPQLMGYLSSFGLGAEETEDIVQETFLALFLHLRLGRDRSNLTGWLFRVAHNLALKRRRTLQRRPAHDSWNDTLEQVYVDPSPDPETRLVHGERRRRIRAVIEALSDRDRRCVCLRSQGLTYRDIATTLGLSLGAVAKSLARAVTRLMNAEGRRS